MSTALHGWLNCAVKVTLRADAPHVLQGTLLHIDDAGIMVETTTAKVFLPLVAISQVELCKDLAS